MCPRPGNERFASGARVEHVLAGIADAATDGLYVFQADDSRDPGALRLVYANPASAAATGVAADEILGRTLSEAFPGLLGTPIPAAYLEIALGGEARHFGEIELGNERVPTQTFSLRAFPLADRSVGVSFTNSTRRREAERRALQTLESMSDAFFTLDSEWRFTYLNEQTEAILDRRREDLVGKNMWDEFPDSVGTGFADAYLRARRDRQPVQVEEIYEPLGRTLQVRAYPVDGGLAVYFRDVTSERRLESRLREAQRLEGIGRVTAGVAHDFNNLLAAVRGFASLGQAVSPDGKAGHYFDQIASAAQKAVELTRQLLAFARQQDLAPTVVDLNDVVEGHASLLRNLLPDGVELHLALAPHLVPVFVDRSQLEQVLLNLVVNGRDAIDGAGAIAVRTSTNRPAGVDHHVTAPSAWLQVEDDGAGIPADVRPHIFDPFFSTKPPETGTGLGLAMIHGIVSQSGGEIFVDSTPGAGTTMTVALPAERRGP